MIVLPSAGVTPPNVTTSGYIAICWVIDRVFPFVFVAVKVYVPVESTTVGVPVRRYVVVEPPTGTSLSPGGNESTVTLEIAAAEKKLPAVMTKSVGSRDLDL